jgi:predicted RND superfamily exporter protein
MLGMAALTTQSRVSFKFLRMLPEDDSVNVAYEQFKHEFSSAGNAVVLGVKDVDFYRPGLLNEWRALALRLEKRPEVKAVLAVHNAVDLVLPDSASTMEARPLMPNEVTSPGEAFAVKRRLKELPFYKGMLISDDSYTQLMSVSLKDEVLYDREILNALDAIKSEVEIFEANTGEKANISGLPYLRMANARIIQKEILLFLGLTGAFTLLIMLAFLRSFRAAAIALGVVLASVLSSFGTMAALGYEITLLLSMVAPLMIVIVVPNCIFLINKFHAEYRDTQDVDQALRQVIKKIGVVTFMTNATTALGFATFIATSSASLVEFGVVASVNILVAFLLSLSVIPVIYSWLTPPKEKHYAHLEQPWIQGLVGLILDLVENKRKEVYIVFGTLLILGIYGITKIDTNGNLTADFKREDPVMQQLAFLEREFKGVVPLEIIIDTREAGGAEKGAVLKRAAELQTRLDSFPEFSRSISASDFLSFGRQAFYGGNPDFYGMPNSQERTMMAMYLPEGTTTMGSDLLRSLMDTTHQKLRITVQAQDISTQQMKDVLARVRSKTAEVFPTDRYDVTVTGAAVLLLETTKYLVNNVLQSLIFAIVVTSILMAFLFKTPRMVVISLIPNLVPLVMTAGIMGYFHIPLKPSTLLVFSIAFGISVDDTLHYLARYRQELQNTGGRIGEAALTAIRETGVSMFYTSVVLFTGFSVFLASEFGGTQALGLLISMTLFFAMVSNLVLLPSLLMTLDWITGPKEFEGVFPMSEDDLPADEGPKILN